MRPDATAPEPRTGVDGSAAASDHPTGRVIVTRELPGDALEVLGRAEDVTDIHVHRGDGPMPHGLLREEVHGAAALLSMVNDTVDADLLAAAGPGLRVVANLAVGYDNIDLDAARERGVTVTNTPGILDDATADLAMGLVLAVSRRIVEADRFIRAGGDATWGPQGFTGLDVSAGATLGIVGLGRIGMAVARRAHGFGMAIVATGSRASGDEAAALGVRPVDLEELVEVSDVVTLHCPLTPATRGLFDAARLRAMRPGAVLVNTARGPVVDEDALLDALADGHLSGAGLDVHAEEPHVHPGLAARDDVVVLPHIGSAGRATREAMARLAVDNITAVLRGDDPPTPVGS